MRAANIQSERCELRALCAGNHGEAFDLDRIRARIHLVAYKRLDVFVVNMLFAIGQILHAVESFFKRVLAEFIAQLSELIAERRAARMFAHHERGLRYAHRGRRHDLVSLLVLQHAVLMDAAFMREGIPADNRLVILHREGRNTRHELRRTSQHRRVDASHIRQFIAARFDGHDDFFQSRITRAFTKTIDRAFDLTRAAF